MILVYETGDRLNVCTFDVSDVTIDDALSAIEAGAVNGVELLEQATAEQSETE
jgi:hypothetical protein